jgi:vancomycin resistance protein VanJ
MRRGAFGRSAIVVCRACGRKNRASSGRTGAHCGACGDVLANAPSGLARVVAATTALYALGLAVAWWFTTRVAEGWWLSTILLYVPRLLYALPLVLLSPLAVWKARRALGPQAGCLLFVLGPLMGWQAPGRGEPPPAGAAPMRVLTYNLGFSPRSTVALMVAAARLQPDVIVAQESRDLTELFPGWRTYHEGEHFLATRLPLLAAETRPYLPDRPWRRGARYRLQGPTGSFTLYALHLDTPRRAFEPLKAELRAGFVRWPNLGPAARVIASDAERRSLEARRARVWVDETTEPCIIVGDFNGPPDTPLCRRLWGGFRDAFAVAGSGYGYTAHAPWPWVRIDRILATRQWHVSRAETAPGSGRDHLPLFADLWQ